MMASNHNTHSSTHPINIIKKSKFARADESNTVMIKDLDIFTVKLGKINNLKIDPLLSLIQNIHRDSGFSEVYKTFTSGLLGYHSIIKLKRQPHLESTWEP